MSALEASATSKLKNPLIHTSKSAITFYSYENIRYLLKAHQMTHVSSEEKRFECPVCHKKFALKKTLQVHETSHKTENKGPYQCSFCSKSFRYVANLDAHERIHTGTRNRLALRFTSNSNSSFVLYRPEAFWLYPMWSCLPTEVVTQRAHAYTRIKTRWQAICLRNL